MICYMTLANPNSGVNNDFCSQGNPSRHSLLECQILGKKRRGTLCHDGYCWVWVGNVTGLLPETYAKFLRPWTILELSSNLNKGQMKMELDEHWVAIRLAWKWLEVETWYGTTSTWSLCQLEIVTKLIIRLTGRQNTSVVCKGNAGGYPHSCTWIGKVPIHACLYEQLATLTLWVWDVHRMQWHEYNGTRRREIHGVPSAEWTWMIHEDTCKHKIESIQWY